MRTVARPSLESAVTIVTALLVLLGAWVLGKEPLDIEFEASWTWFVQSLDNIWWPLLVGSQLMGVMLGVLGYWMIDTMWRNAVRRQWHARRKRRQ